MSLERPISRRSFLHASAAAGAGLALPTLMASCSAGAPGAIEELRQRLPGRVLVPGDPEYRTFVTPWNLQFEGMRPRAQAIVRARSTDDVRTAIRWATATETPVVARSGGHSYAGFSTTTGVVIDVSSMTDVDFAPSTGIATLAGGVRNIDAYQALEKVDRTVTHGRCFQVGFAGLVLGGGIGFNTRRLGLTCDQLLETTLVLASGDIVRASPDENPDLFWAVRGGGGGNFGINTSFRVLTHPAPPLTVFDFVWVDRLESVTVRLLELLQDAPRELGAKLTVRATPQPSGGPRLTVGLLGQFVGSVADTMALLRPVLDISPPDPSYGFIRETPYWEGQKAVSDAGARERSAERSHYIDKQLDRAAVDTVFDQLRRWPELSGTAQWKGFATGGAANDVPSGATAFVHRSNWLLATADVTWNADASPDSVQSALAWVDGFHAAMAPFGTGGSYQNFIDAREKDWARAYYGQNLRRLVEVKRTVDPTNVFTFAQSIPLEL